MTINILTTSVSSEKRIIAGHQKNKERNYWLKKLSGNLQASRIFYDFDLKSTGEKQLPGDKGHVRLEIPQTLCAKLLSAAKGSDYALHVILAAGLILLLDRYTYSDNKDFIIGSPIYRQEIEGEFINTLLPLRIRMDTGMTFKKLLAKVKQTVVEAVEHQNYPLDLLIPELDLAFSLFDIAILLENLHDRDYLQGINPEIIISFKRTGETLEGEIEYNALRYRKGTIERTGRHFTRLLYEALTHADMELSAVDMLSADEKKQLLTDFNDIRSPYPESQTIPRLFAEQVNKSPHKIAVVYQDYYVTYRELDNRADGLARHLKTGGLVPDTPVGLMVERSIDMIVGILGILKAGGAYLPIDPEFPLKRILSMLEDSQASFLLTNKTFYEKYSITSLMGLEKKRLIPFKTAIRTHIHDLDALPIPDRSLVNYEIYNQYNGMALVKHKITLQGTRGCPFKCAYCHKVWPKTHVVRSARHIFDEVKLYYDIGIRRFAFIDDIFNWDQENSAHFFRLIIKNRLKVHLFFPNGIRCDVMTHDYIDLMVEAGLVNIAFALETASPRLQKFIKKNLNLERFRNNLEYILAKYPHVIVDIFTMHGFPTETKEEAIMTLDFIKSMKWLHFPFIWILKIYPNTDMEKLALDHGVNPKDIAASETLGYHNLSYTLPWEDSFTLQYQADFFNNYFLDKQRLLHVLPHQINILTEDEILQKYNSYLPTEIKSFSQLLKFLGVNPGELNHHSCRPNDYMFTPDLHRKLKAHFPDPEPDPGALRVLLLDVTFFFGEKKDDWRFVVEPPLGLMYILTYLRQKFGSKVKGKIAKTRIDINCFSDLIKLLEEFKPHVIGIRALSLYKKLFHQVAAVIRQGGFKGSIAAGGPYATTSFDTLLQDKNIDVVVLGEGEITFAEFIEKVMENKGQLPTDDSLKQIAGIAFIPKSIPKGRYSPQFVLLDEFYGSETAKTRENQEDITRPTNLAYVMYTSGSTGKPKGVMVEHKNVARLVKNTNYIDLRENDRLLLTGAFAFDITTFEFWAPLLNGLSLYLVDKNIVLDAKKMRKAIAKNDISILHLIPQLFNQLLTQEPGIFARLRYFLVGGDMVSPGYINRLRKKYGDLRILHMYGPTENTTFSTFLPIHKDYGANIPIGKPISNTTAYIVDKSDRLQSLGVPGELYVGGHGIARGYLNRPELTAGKFFPWRPGDSLFEGTRGLAPLSLIKQPYMSHRSYFYRTGDLARWLPDGNIEFLGRIDQQLKISGIRIELGEIENILRRNQALEDCVVVSRKINGENQVIAYYKKKNPVELWPSMAEYFAYDELLYHAIANDEARNEKYRKAIQKAVKGKVVLEIGPGNDAILSRMCIEAGAKKVYAVEILENAYQKAVETIKKLKLENKINLIHGDITRLKLPEPVDYCVAEIVGSIGGAEGAASLINSLHQGGQMKKTHGMIPCRSITKIAAITLPPGEFAASFEEVGAHYVGQVFEHVGRKFDLRLCLLSFPPGNIISNEDIFEELDFTRENQLETEHDIYLEITHQSIMHGFVAWLVLYCDEEEVIDTLAKRYIWLPIYFPVFSEGQPVKKGDYIKAKITRKLSVNNLNPDFTLEGFLYKKQENQSMDFIYHSPHLAVEFKANPFYKRLFSLEKVKITSTITPTVIREFLAAELPEYMLPQYIIELENLPLTATGKIDRGALPSPEHLKGETGLVGPRNEIEHKITETVKQVLNREDVGIFNDFFEMGGNSLKAMELVSKLSEDFDITINHLFQYRTIAGIAEKVTWQKDTLEKRIQDIKQGLSAEPTADEIAANQKASREVEKDYQQYLERVEQEKLPCLTTEQDYSNILMTGSTGYMGAHLLYELIKETKAVLHLPVRGSSPANARERLDKKLSFYFGKSFFEENQERLQVVCGDLRKEKLGIEDPLYEKLTEITDAVIHASANVRFYGFYKDFYQDNVESTQKLLEFSLTGKEKDFHHISTPGVGNGNVKGKKYMLFSEYCYNVGQTFDNVYDQTKLEAEEMVLAYRERGIDARIYRVGSLLCHSETGKSQENIEDSGFYARLKAYITLGRVPELNIMNYDMTFVDQVAKALIILLKRENLSNETYHIYNPHILPWQQMVPFFNKCRLKVKVVKPVEFLDYLLECIEKDNHRELIDRLLLHSGLLNRELADWITLTRYAADRTIGILEKIGFQWEKPNESNIKKMIEYCQRIGFIPINQRSRENKNNKTK